MAITTLDGLIAGMKSPFDFYKPSFTTVAGRLFSLFYQPGLPGAAVAPSPGLAGAALTTYAGQIPFSNPGSGNTCLSRFNASGGAIGQIFLCDRLWHNSGFNVTLNSPQSINSVTFPARDRNGATNGEGILIGLEVSATMGAGTPTISLSYTNSDGTSGHTSPGLAMASAMIAGSFIPLPLAAGDKGVRSVQSLTQSASMTSGTYHLVAYRVLAVAGIGAATIGENLNPFDLGMPRLFDDTVPFLLLLPSGSTSGMIMGSVGMAQG